MHDYLGIPVEVGDIVLDSRGLVWRVQPTEASIVLRGHNLTCLELRYLRGAWTACGLPSHLPIGMLIKAVLVTLPHDQSIRRAMWARWAAPQNALVAEAIKARKIHLDAILTERGLRR